MFIITATTSFYLLSQQKGSADLLKSSASEKSQPGEHQWKQTP